jgi:hypothetical protein
MVRWLCMCAIGCGASSALVLPPRDAAFEDRLLAYRLNHIKADVKYSRHGGVHGSLGDDRPANPDTLAEIPPDSEPARALRRWRAHDATATLWGRIALATLALAATAGVGEYETMPHGPDRAAAIGLTWTGAIVGFTFAILEEGFANQRAKADTKHVLWDYNAQLRARLALCTRKLELVDCDALNSSDDR